MYLNMQTIVAYLLLWKFQVMHISVGFQRNYIIIYAEGFSEFSEIYIDVIPELTQKLSIAI